MLLKENTTEVKKLYFKILITSYLLSVISLFFYSFTQVDLGLTLTEWSIWLEFQAFFQQIGFFQRPLSTYLYLGIVFFMFVFYGIFLFLAQKNKVTKKQAWIVIGAASTILLFSYNAFSYDLFNYIFDAKIVTNYGQNPYEHKALDYPGEVMLGFMRWTHRVYPYGPAWLLLTIPLSFVGMQKLLVTIMLFKSLAYISFLGATYFIGKIVKKISPQNEISSIVFFALNPLVLIESLVSAHNDIVMMALALWSLWFLLDKKYIGGFLLLIFSIGIKFGSVFLLPLFLARAFMQYKKKEMNWQIFSLLSIGAMIVPIFLAAQRTNFQPWYLLLVLPFAAFLSNKYFVLIPTFIMSVFSLLQYVPFLYLGNWDPPVPMYLYWLTVGSLIVSVVSILLLYIFSLVKRA